MALADYFGRNATAAAQILTRFDETVFKEKLYEAGVGIGIAKQAASTEGRALLDMTVRLIARLYPAFSLRVGSGADDLAAELVALARGINPHIEIHEGDAKVEIAVGPNAPIFAPLVFYAGSHGWDAHLSMGSEQTVGSSKNPFGAGAAACFACANVFRTVFLDGGESTLDKDLQFSVLDLTSTASRRNMPLKTANLEGDMAIVGLGAIGNAAIWALSRVPLAGTIQLIDPEDIELSNLQRYVLCNRDDERNSKVTVASKFFTGGLSPVQHRVAWADFVQNHGYHWPRVLVAVDSARDRRAVQGSLPRWIANAWTQPADLGLSVHSFDGEGACLNCLYLPQEALQNEDEIIANALQVPDRLMQIRQLLYYNGDTPRDLLDAIANKLDVPLEKLLAFEGRPLRTLYVEGVCGGAVIPLGRNGTPRQDVHVPLAHQSALAGLLLAGALVADVLGVSYTTTMITRINLMRPLGAILSQPARKDSRGICICQDPDYVDAYRRKYPSASPNGRQRTRLQRSSPSMKIALGSV